MFYVRSILTHKDQKSNESIIKAQTYNSSYLFDSKDTRGVSRIFERGGSNISWFPRKRSSDFKRGSSTLVSLGRQILHI